MRDKWGRPVAYVIKDWHSHDQALMDTLADQCGEILRRGGEGVQFSGRGLGRRRRSRGSPTTCSAARASAPIRHDSVLDPDCRAWEFENLYVTDGAFMPTSGGANPTLTIQANSLRVGQALLGRL